MNNENIIKIKKYLEINNIKNNEDLNDVFNILLSLNSKDKFKIKNLDKMISNSKPVIDRLSIFIKKYDDTNNILKFINSEVVQTKEVIKDCKGFPTFTSNEKGSISNELDKIKYKNIFKINLSNNHHINLYFYTKMQIKDSSNNIVNNLAKIIYTFCESFGYLSKDYESTHSENLNDFNIRILLINFNRQLNNNLTFSQHSELGIYNNSSGYTNIFSKEMVVSRIRGISGLLIHELIHLLNLDFYNRNLTGFQNNKLETITKNLWYENTNIQKCNSKGCMEHFSLNETICNTISSYFLSIYCGIIYYNDSTHSANLSEFKKGITLETNIKLFYLIEYVHCFINCVKIINYFGFNKYEDFFNNTSNRIFNQKAHVFEYSILRIFLISHFNELITKRFTENNILNLKQFSFDESIDINEKLMKIMKNDFHTKKFFNHIMNEININKNNFSNSIEYFCINII